MLKDKTMPELVRVFRSTHGSETAARFAAEVYKLCNPYDTLTCGKCVYGVSDGETVLCLRAGGKDAEMHKDSPCWDRGGVERTGE